MNYCSSEPGTNTFSNIRDVQLFGDNYNINNLGNLNVNQYKTTSSNENINSIFKKKKCVSGPKKWCQAIVDEYMPPGKEVGDWNSQHKKNEADLQTKLPEALKDIWNRESHKVSN